jgi:hypothetical protein
VEEAKAAPTGTPAEQVAKLVALEGKSREGTLTYRYWNGRDLVFCLSKRVPAKTLQSQCGDPDEMRKWADPTASGGSDAARKNPTWKIWIWGNTSVLVDEAGMARYVSTAKE